MMMTIYTPAAVAAANAYLVPRLDKIRARLDRGGILTKAERAALYVIREAHLREAYIRDAHQLTGDEARAAVANSVRLALDAC